MRNHFLTGLLGLTLGFFACKNNNSVPASPLKAEIKTFNKKFCVSEGQCATFDVSLPELGGGDPATTTVVNHSVQSFVLSTVGANESLPFPVAMDSAATQFIETFKQAQAENAEMATMGYTMEIKGNSLLLNSKVATVHLDGYSFMGGAHPNPFTTIVSYNLADSGKVLTVNALVSDTNALRPMLEKGYKEAKGMKPEDKISDLLYPELQQLPMPANTAVLPQGIMFYYNAYEVAPYAVGPTEVILSWEQLGALPTSHLLIQRFSCKTRQSAGHFAREPGCKRILFVFAFELGRQVDQPVDIRFLYDPQGQRAFFHQVEFALPLFGFAEDFVHRGFVLVVVFLYVFDSFYRIDEFQVLLQKLHVVGQHAVQFLFGRHIAVGNAAQVVAVGGQPAVLLHGSAGGVGEQGAEKEEEQDGFVHGRWWSVFVF